jgi:hypothetical protein
VERKPLKEIKMIRHPMLDMFTGAAIAMGGPVAFMLPQRIFFAMMTGCLEDPKPVPAERSRRTAV